MDNKPTVTSVEQQEQIELLEQQTGTTTETLVNQDNTGTPVDLQHDPADAAAVFFSREKPLLVSLLNGMSVKQIRRFVVHVASYPLLGPGDILQSEEEKRAAYLFGQMVWNKSIMQLQLEMEKHEAAMKQQQELENNKQATDVAEGSSNG